MLFIENILINRCTSIVGNITFTNTFSLSLLVIQIYFNRMLEMKGSKTNTKTISKTYQNLQKKKRYNNNHNFNINLHIFILEPTLDEMEVVIQ